VKNGIFRNSSKSSNISRRFILQSFALLPFITINSDAKTQTDDEKRVQAETVIIVGATLAGVTLAQKIKKKSPSNIVKIIQTETEESSYLAGLNLVATGLWSFKELFFSDTLKNIDIIQSNIKQYIPNENKIIIGTQESVSYDKLIIAKEPLLQYILKKDFSPFSRETCIDFFDSNTCSAFYMAGAKKTYKNFFAFIKKIKKETTTQKHKILFFHPKTSNVSSHVSLELLFLFYMIIKKEKLEDKVKFEYYTAESKLFRVEKYNNVFLKEFTNKNIDLFLDHNLIEVNYEKQLAIFNKKESSRSEKVEFKYNFLHIAPSFAMDQEMKEAGLVQKNNFIDLKTQTLEHSQYSNIYAIGNAVAVSTYNSLSLKNQCDYILQSLYKKKTKRETKIFSDHSFYPMLVDDSKGISLEYNNFFKVQPRLQLKVTEKRWIWWLSRIYFTKYFYKFFS